MKIELKGRNRCPQRQFSGSRVKQQRDSSDTRFHKYDDEIQGAPALRMWEAVVRPLTPDGRPPSLEIPVAAQRAPPIFKALSRSLPCLIVKDSAGSPSVVLDCTSPGSQFPDRGSGRIVETATRESKTVHGITNWKILETLDHHCARSSENWSFWRHQCP